MENRHIPRRSHQRGGRATSDGFIVRSQPRIAPRRQVFLDAQRIRIAPTPITKQVADDTVKLRVKETVPTHSAPQFEAVVNEETLKLDMRLPGVEQLLRKRPITLFSRWRFLRSPAFKAAAGSAGVVLVLGGWLLGQAYLNLMRSFQGNKTTVVSLQKKVDPHLLKGEGDGRVNILLLGNGGLGHEAPDLTDTIMVASIDPVNNKVALVSVPRDLWITLPGHGSMKLNAAYETGKYDYLGKIDSSNANSKAVEAGFATADQALEQVLGITIHYNTLVNFISFRQAVNILGGINVNVPETLYDPTMAWENGWNSVLARKGSQVFNGKQALLYVRSRHTSSDFARANRQRAVITAIKDKVTTVGTLSNPIKLSQLLSTLGSNVRTDLSLKDAGRVYELTKGIADKAIASIGLGDGNTLVTTGRAGSQSIVLPTAGLSDYDAIHRYIRQQLPDGYIVKECAKVQVVNATVDPNFGKTQAEDLATYGYNVTQVVPYGTALGSSKLIDLSHGKKKYTKNYLEHHYGVKATTKLPGGVQADGADFIIVLGNNETADQ